METAGDDFRERIIVDNTSCAFDVKSLYDRGQQCRSPKQQRYNCARAHIHVLLLLRDEKITFEAVVSIRLNNNNNTTTKNQCVRHAATGDRKREC